MGEYVLFLDDERDPPKSGDVFGWEVVHAKNIREFVEVVKTRGAPAIVYFDWYLGAGQPDGIEAARWLIFHDADHDVIREDLMFESQSSDREKGRTIVKMLAEYISRKFPAKDADDVLRAARRATPRAGMPRPPLRRF